MNIKRESDEHGARAASTNNVRRNNGYSNKYPRGMEFPEMPCRRDESCVIRADVMRRTGLRNCGIESELLRAALAAVFDFSARVCPTP